MKRPEKQNVQRENRNWRKTAILAFILMVLAFLPYLQTVEHDFVNYDDPGYVTKNDAVRSGLSFEGVRWAFTTFHAANWHPLTWMSHMLDVSLFGIDPGRHHLTSAFLHSLSTALLFLSLFRMTGAVWRSVFVAALFGVHPLHVESVAWIAERKDVLSGFFFMLVLLSYEQYVRHGGTGRYLTVLGSLTLGLLSKPMLVTVPAVLLLLDIWPLGRTTFAPSADGGRRKPAPWDTLLIEKAPMVLLSILSAAVTVVAQRTGGAMSAMEHDLLPFAWRVANALLTYVSYLGKMLWPADLSILYLHPGVSLPGWKIAGSAAALLAVSVLVMRQFRQRPYLAVGWYWYLGMLFPVIGVVQVGIQAMADRYTYLPLIGTCLMIAWSAGEVADHLGSAAKKALAAAAGAVLAVLLVISTVQAGHWRDSVSLFAHAASIDPGNWFVHRSLGMALSDAGRPADAVEAYRNAITLKPRDARAHNDLGVELAGLGRSEEAALHYREALRLRPDFAEACNNLGNALAMLGRRDEAIEQYRAAIRLRPGWTVARNNLQLLLAEQDRTIQGRRK